MGEGTPHDGSALDNSAQLRQLQSQVQAAAPNDRWTGQAADAYGTANEKQAQRLTRMAELDQQLGAEVNRSAQVVTAGRQNLDSIRQWVNDAAASVTGSDDQEQQLQIARKGVSDVSNVVRQTHGELKSIGQRIQNIGQQYSALGAAGKTDQNTANITNSKFPTDRTDGDEHNPYKPGDPRYDGVESKLWDWYAKNEEIQSHNDHPPNPPTPAAVAAYNLEADKLTLEQLQLSYELADVGVQTIIYPPERLPDPEK